VWIRLLDRRAGANAALSIAHEMVDTTDGSTQANADLLKCARDREEKITKK